MVAAQHFHQLVLQLVNILKLIDHNIFQTLLPFQADILVLLKDIQCKLDQVVIIQAKALFLLIQVAVKDDILCIDRLQILFMQDFQRHGKHVPVVVRLLENLADLNHVPRFGKGHVTQGQAALLVDGLQHYVNIRVVQHQKTLGILHRMAVFLQDGNAEAVEGADIARVIVPGELMDALAHFSRRLVGECDAQDAARQDAHLVHQIGKAVRKRACLARACARDHADKALGRCDRFPLLVIQFAQKPGHMLPPPLFVFVIIT